jgi:probable rRNA maturation factor
MKPIVEIAIESEKWADFADADLVAETAIAEAVRQSGTEVSDEAEISLLLCDDDFIRGLNEKWRGIDKPTNVLSFPTPAGQGVPSFLGDIAIAYETMAREADEEGKSLRDHFTHLIVHGYLHLVGHDHVAEAEAEAMEQRERSILAKLGIDDPYRGASTQAVDR